MTVKEDLVLEAEGASRWRQKGRKCERTHPSDPQATISIIIIIIIAQLAHL